MVIERFESWKKRLFYTDRVPDDRSRMRAVANNLILHLHPTKVPAPALRWTYTWGLGGLSAMLATILVATGALRNFYAIHVAVLPAILVALLSYHFWKVRKDGGISQPRRGPRERVERLTTIPHLVWIEVAAAAGLIAGLLLFAAFVPAPLEALADPSPEPGQSCLVLPGAAGVAAAYAPAGSHGPDRCPPGRSVPPTPLGWRRDGHRRLLPLPHRPNCSPGRLLTERRSRALAGSPGRIWEFPGDWPSGCTEVTTLTDAVGQGTHMGRIEYSSSHCPDEPGYVNDGMLTLICLDFLTPWPWFSTMTGTISY